MKKILFLLVLVLLCACHKSFVYNVPLNPIDSFYSDNFRYPSNISEFINYLKYYEKEVDVPLYKEFYSRRRHIRILSNDSVFIILYKNDTVDYRPKLSPCNLDNMPDEMWNMRLFDRVSMQTDVSCSANIATYEMMSRFNRGLYETVSQKKPEFWKNRDNKLDFKVVILGYENNKIHKVCESDPFDLINYPLYEDISAYVERFAAEESINKIFFYYMYD